MKGDRIYGGVFAVLAFPATRPSEYVSLRYSDSEGREHEAGIVREPSQWRSESQRLLKEALGRRYFIHVIAQIEGIELKFGYLIFKVRTNRGDERFMMRWNQSQAQDHGQSGKILTDVDENRYLVPDVDALPRRQQILFRRFVYW